MISFPKFPTSPMGSKVLFWRLRIGISPMTYVECKQEKRVCTRMTIVRKNSQMFLFLNIYAFEVNVKLI